MSTIFLQEQNQSQYINDGKFKPGTYVFLDKKEKQFAKSFDVKVS
jgi:hypothetical protein